MSKLNCFPFNALPKEVKYEERNSFFLINGAVGMRVCLSKFQQICLLQLQFNYQSSSCLLLGIQKHVLILLFLPAHKANCLLAHQKSLISECF